MWGSLHCPMRGLGYSVCCDGCGVCVWYMTWYMMRCMTWYMMCIYAIIYAGVPDLLILFPPFFGRLVDQAGEITVIND